MKKKKAKEKEDEEYYVVSFLVTAILTLLIHWLVLSQFNFHPTIHVLIGLGIFMVIISILTPIFKKILAIT